MTNESPVVPPEALNRLTHRFERGSANVAGSGLGLAIVAKIAERIGSALALASPVPGTTSGFSAEIQLPSELDERN